MRKGYWNRVKNVPISRNVFTAFVLCATIDVIFAEVTVSILHEIQQGLIGVGGRSGWSVAITPPPPVPVYIGLVLMCCVDGGVQTSHHSEEVMWGERGRRGEERRPVWTLEEWRVLLGGLVFLVQCLCVCVDVCVWPSRGLEAINELKAFMPWSSTKNSSLSPEFLKAHWAVPQVDEQTWWPPTHPSALSCVSSVPFIHRTRQRLHYPHCTPAFRDNVSAGRGQRLDLCRSKLVCLFFYFFTIKSECVSHEDDI